MNKANAPKILIVDDSEMNRELLRDILDDRYDILDADDGKQALQILDECGSSISMMLLDIVMPTMDGFELRLRMPRRGLMDRIPVIMISAETATSAVRYAYELGVTDFISRPFDAQIVRKRISNTLQLYAKQRRLVEMVTDEVYEKKKSNTMMVTIHSNIVEVRNGESGLHVLHVNLLTDILLKAVCKKTDRYHLTEEDIENICMASAMHDIGKLVIPDNILNKPGRLTREEFEIMKMHTTAGAQLLETVPFDQHEPLLVASRQICRWHHERYDGNGYPDGLKGEEIPIGAQVVSIADVYDALTSQRVYKAAYSHEEAMRMIVEGECGAYNPLLIECLVENDELIRQEMRVMSYDQRDKAEVVERTMRRLEQEVNEKRSHFQL